MREMPSIDIDENKLSKYAKEILSANTAITGVQPKLSLWLEESKKNVRFTIIDNKSNYIIKPQSDTFASLPENEDLCMHLANQFGIETAGFKWSPIKYMYKQWAGLYQVGEQYIYVNRGFGYLGYPGRLGIRPEIGIVTLA
jgi:hypothetical protein